MKRKKKTANSVHLDLDSQPISNNPNNHFPSSSVLHDVQAELFTLRAGPNCFDFDYSANLTDFFKLYIPHSFMVLDAEQENLDAS